MKLTMTKKIGATEKTCFEARNCTILTIQDSVNADCQTGREERQVKDEPEVVAST